MASELRSLPTMQRQTTDPAQDDKTNKNNNSGSDSESNSNKTETLKINLSESQSKPKPKSLRFSSNLTIENSPLSGKTPSLSFAPSVVVHQNIPSTNYEIYEYSDVESEEEDLFSDDDDTDVEDEINDDDVKTNNNDTNNKNNRNKPKKMNSSGNVISENDIPETRPYSRSVKMMNPSKNITEKERARRQSARFSHLINARKLTIYGDLLSNLNNESDSDEIISNFNSGDEKDDNNASTEELPSVPLSLHEKHKSMMIAREYIEKELIDTEESYVNGLSVLCVDIYDVIWKEKMIKIKHKQALESNIRMIFEFHQQFLPLLKKGPISKVFNTQADFFKIYTVYVTSYDAILNKFSEFHKVKKLQAFLRAKRKQKKPLTNHLILPIQRIPRYTLLLTDLMKKTPQEHPEYKDLSDALSKIDEISKFINERKREIENMSQCLQVQSRLKDLHEKIVEPHRKFLKQYFFFRKRKPRQFFLFNDLLIIADQKFKVKEKLPMRTLTIRHDTSEKTEFTVYSDSKPKVYNSEEVEEIEDFIKRIEKYRAKVWEGDVSRLSRSGNAVIKQLLNEHGVSQDQEYRNQVTQKRQKNAETADATGKLDMFAAVHQLGKIQKEPPKEIGGKDNSLSNMAKNIANKSNTKL